MLPRGRRGPGLRPRQGRSPLRPQAGQHPARRPRPGLGRRLRPGPSRQRRLAGPGHLLLHGPRTGRPHAGHPRHPLGRVRPRRRGLRPADRRPAVRGRVDPRAAGPSRWPASAAASATANGCARRRSRRRTAPCRTWTPAFAAVIDRCLEVDPEKRYRDAGAVLDALNLRERRRRQTAAAAVRPGRAGAAAGGDGAGRLVSPPDGRARLRGGADGPGAGAQPADGPGHGPAGGQQAAAAHGHRGHAGRRPRPGAGGAATASRATGCTIGSRSSARPTRTSTSSSGRWRTPRDASSPTTRRSRTLWDQRPVVGLARLVQRRRPQVPSRGRVVPAALKASTFRSPTSAPASMRTGEPEPVIITISAPLKDPDDPTTDGRPAGGDAARQGPVRVGADGRLRREARLPGAGQRPSGTSWRTATATP